MREAVSGVNNFGVNTEIRALARCRAVIGFAQKAFAAYRLSSE